MSTAAASRSRYDFQDYRRFLREQLQARIAIAPRYSLRQFARRLGLSPAHLVQIMDGKRNLSRDRAETVADRLELTVIERALFLLRVRIAATNDPTLQASLETSFRRRQIGERLRKSPPSRAFSCLSDWYYLPIIEMTRLASNGEPMRLTARTIAQRLSIAPIEAERALTRLEEAGMLSKLSGRRGYVKVERNAVFDAVVAPPAAVEDFARFHQMTLQKTQEHLRTESPDRRYVGWEAIAINREDLARARKRIDRFLDRMVQEFGARSDAPSHADAVFQLGVQFIPLTKDPA